MLIIREQTGTPSDVNDHDRKDRPCMADNDTMDETQRDGRTTEKERRVGRVRRPPIVYRRSRGNRGKKGAPSCLPPVDRTIRTTRDARATRNLERSYAATSSESGRAHGRARGGKVRDGSPQKLTRPIQHGGLARR